MSIAVPNYLFRLYKNAIFKMTPNINALNTYTYIHEYDSNTRHKYIYIKY